MARDTTTSLHPKAGLVLSLNALYNVAEALCSVFVGVYFYVNSLDFRVVCLHYATLYAVTPVVFLLAGWYAKTRDRVHVFRIGLVLHAAYYGALLWLQEDSADHAVALGVLLGVTWGFFWAGNNTFTFDYSTLERRDYFLGMLSTVSAVARLAGPLIAGLIIGLAPHAETGYRAVFTLALLLYLAAIAASMRIPHDGVRRPFHPRPAFFPPSGDWRLVMAASATLAGSFHILQFVLAVILFLRTGSEISVGGFASAQGLIGVAAAWLVGRTVTVHTRKPFMLAGTLVMVAAGCLVAWRLDLVTLVLFGFLRSVSEPLFGIPHTGIRFDVMSRTAAPGDRIEYLAAWELPLAAGRLFTMTLVVLLYTFFGETGLRAAIALVSLYRVGTYLLLRRVSIVARPELLEERARG